MLFLQIVIIVNNNNRYRTNSKYKQQCFLESKYVRNEYGIRDIHHLPNQSAFFIPIVSGKSS